MQTKYRVARTGYAVLFLLISFCAGAQTEIFRDPNQPLDARINDLVARLTLEEKALQMMHRSPAIPRLNIPAYNWWNEALHGVGRSGVATIFPQAIGLGATFDEDLIFRVATAISDEARANYNVSTKKGYHLQYSGLTFWTPNINIFRDPRWGRGQETYGEDPYLTSRLGMAFVRGLQGDHPGYLKTAACAKHFAVHSGPERLRHEFDATSSKKDLYETYLPAFKALVETGVEAVMCAYNSTNGEPCCSNSYLLQDVLRGEWQFKGHIVSDCWALVDLYSDNGHKTVPTKEEAVALAVKRGVNLNCGDEFPVLVDAVKKGLITEKEIDDALKVLLRTRFKLGMFDPVDDNPWASLDAKVIDSDKHRRLAREAALKSIVMLKNDGVLPLRNDLKKYFVTGPNAETVYALIGNYYGVNPNMVTYLEGIAAAIEPGSQLHYKPGIMIDRANVNPIDWTTGDARSSDATIVVLGLTGALEGEEGESIASPHYGDRLDYNLPQVQIDFLKKLREGHNRPIIAVITGGSPMNLSEVHELADAVLLVWYAGEEAGNALADIVFGKVAPSGRLPITFPKSLDQLPPYEDYSMKGRTYRYMEAEPMYPFGYGLSYAKFAYGDIKLSATTIKKGQSIDVDVTVSNPGQLEAEDVVQLYLTDLASKEEQVPLFSLKGIKRVNVAPGQSQVVRFTITPDMMAIVNTTGESVVEPGDFRVSVGGAVPIKRSIDLGVSAPAQATFRVR